jgi:glycosyltransferase involved in cell wall biosynthesis
MPALSVVMPVRNGAPYLSAAMESVLGQTFPDFELVVLDDASTDGTPGLLEGWAARDPRIRVVRSPGPLGTAESSNQVVALARATICARMDADDVAHPDRLRRQWDLLARHPDVVLVGTLWEGIDPDGRLVRPRDRWALLRRSGLLPFTHGSIMFRRADFDAVGGYRAECGFGAARVLCIQLARRGRVLVVPDALYRYRFHAASVTTAAPDISGLDEMYRAEKAPDSASNAAADRGERVQPETAYYLAASRLWAGQSPGLCGRLDSAPWRPAALKAWILAGWGRRSPTSLRRALAWGICFRDAFASLRLAGCVAVDWRFR